MKASKLTASQLHAEISELQLAARGVTDPLCPKAIRSYYAFMAAQKINASLETK